METNSYEMGLKKLSKKQLCDLRNKINEEINFREKTHCKSETNALSQLIDIFENDLKENGIDHEKIHYYLGGVETGIFKICDYTRKNYYIKANKMSFGSGYILDDFDKYKDMVNEIIEIIRKYYKEDK